MCASVCEIEWERVRGLGVGFRAREKRERCGKSVAVIYVFVKLETSS